MNSINKVINRLAETVGECQHHLLIAKQGSSILTDVNSVLNAFKGLNLAECDQLTREKAIKLLMTLDHKVSSFLQPGSKKMAILHEKIIRLQTRFTEKLPDTHRGQKQGVVDGLQQKYLENTELKSSASSRVDVIIAHFCDFDFSDLNGAIQNDLLQACHSDIPFIVSPTLFLDPDKKVTLSERSAQWDIFAQANSKGDQGMLVFIPKAFNRGKSDLERLEALDLKIDGSINKITLQEALDSTTMKHSLEDFQNLFSENPKKNKLFLLCGHGGVGNPGGMSREHFEGYLTFIDQQKCQGMFLSSCYAGGKSSFLFLPNSDESRKGVSFPVVVESIGDLPTVSGTFPLIRSYLDQMKMLIEKPLRGGPIEWGQAFRGAGGEKGNPDVSNYLQIYFPSSLYSLAGFRSPGETADLYSLTLSRLRQHEFDTIKGGSKQVVIKGRGTLVLYPLVIESPIVFQGMNPKLLSGIADQAHHFIKEIVLDDDNPTDWFLKMYRFYSFYRFLPPIHISKAFYIKSLRAGSQTYENVIISLHASKLDIYYSENGKYFWLGEWGLVPLDSELEYCLRTLEIQESTRPSNLFVKVATSGLQEEAEFIDALQEAHFFPEEYSILADTGELRSLDERGFAALSSWFGRLETGEKTEVLFYLMRYVKEDWVIRLIADHRLSTNLVNKAGKSLLKYCLEMGQSDSDLIQTLKRYDFDLDMIDEWGMTELGRAMQTMDIKRASVLLEAGADINKVASSLVSAVRIGDADFMQLILDKRTNITIDDIEFRKALAEAKTYDNKMVFAQLIQKRFSMPESVHFIGDYDRLKTINESNFAELSLWVGGLSAKDRIEVLFYLRGYLELNWFARLMKDHGIPLSVVNNTGKSLLKYSSDIGMTNIPLIKELAKLGLDLDVLDDKGMTQLEIAMTDGDIRLAASLIHAGADLNKLKYPLTLAMNMSWDFVQLVFEKGATIDLEHILQNVEWSKIESNIEGIDANILLQHVLPLRAARTLDVLKLALRNGAAIDEENERFLKLMKLASSFEMFEVLVNTRLDRGEPLVVGAKFLDDLLQQKSTELYERNLLRDKIIYCFKKGLVVLNDTEKQEFIGMLRNPGNERILQSLQDIGFN